ncbi:MAG: hypothetical protein RL062_659 [Bacteroidota bacterium]|jgi:hypothetical protein
MENHFIPLQSLAQQLADQLNGLYSGQNKKDSLEQMVNHSRELYERLIVLRHKAYEVDVRPENNQPTIEPISEITLEELPVFEIELPENIEESSEENSVETFELEVPEETVEVEEPSPIDSDVRQVNLMDMIEEVTQSQSAPAQEMEENTPIISLNDILAQQQTQHTILKRLEKAPIDDLKKSITMNQRFQFARELFMGDSEQYEISISDLNNASGEKAMEILDQLKKKFNWNTASIAYIELEELVQRRHF